METEKVETVIPRDAFGYRIKKEPAKAEEYKGYKMTELGLELNKETGETTIIVTNYVDLDQEILAALPSSGLAGMMAVIRRGQAVPRDFYDRGEPFADVSEVPECVNDAYQEALKKAGPAEAIRKGLDISKETTVKELDDVVRAKIQKNLDEINALMAVSKKEGE